MTEVTKEKLLAELKELEDLEKKVKAKKSDVANIGAKFPFKIGETYFIRTVTYHATGRVKAIVGDFLVLEEAAWIADSGRFDGAINKGELDEIEPIEVEMYLNIQSITDAFLWVHKLPRKQK